MCIYRKEMKVKTLTMLRVCMMHACVVFSTWINSSQSSWSNPLTSDRILIGDRAASLSVDLPLSGDGINSCPSSSSSSARSSQSVVLISCHRFHRSILVREITADGKPINERIRWFGQLCDAKRICIGIIYPRAERRPRAHDMVINKLGANFKREIFF